MFAQHPVSEVLEGNAGPDAVPIEERRDQRERGVEDRSQAQMNAPVVRNRNGYLAGL
jgi:hypothetical protein